MVALDANLVIVAADDEPASPDQARPASGAWRRAADRLCLAATPTFAIMALVSGDAGRGPQEMFCSAMSEASPLSGMAGMYMLMSAFHAAPWLKLMSRKGAGADRDLPPRTR